MKDFIYAKKSLGQNFLKSKEAIRDIIEAASLSATDIVLEIGPGKGVLTESLLEKTNAGKVIAIEKDDRMIPLLEEKFSKEIAGGNLILIHGDILETDKAALEALGLQNGKYKLIANIPYYITGQLFRMFLESDLQPSKMVLMVQKEVAQRIVTRDGRESILSVSVKAYGNPKYIAKVAAKYFSPEPKVDSAILLVDNISKSFFETAGFSEARFFEVIKKGFAHKRKQLAGNLELSLEEKGRIYAAAGLDENIRAENLTLEQWKKLIPLLS